jgi:hypothetical protein
LNSGSNKLLDNAMSASADGVVLVFHDGACSKGLLRLQISRKSWDGGHYYPDLEWLTLFIRSNDAVNYGGTDLVGDGALFITRGRDEELVKRISTHLILIVNAVCLLTWFSM